MATLRWDDLSLDVRQRAPLVLLDALGCGYVGERVGFHRDFVDGLEAMGGPGEAVVWARGSRLPAAHAALANGTVAHHVEMDDGNPRASLHGGVTVIPAACAMAEVVGASGRALLEAIVAGYDAAIACGRTLLPGIGRHRLHPPSMVGAYGAAAAAARLLGLDADGVARAVSLAAILAPMGPFEPFTRGASIKDLYGGWPACVGVQAAFLARDGLSGPLDVFEAPRDGLGTFLLHAPVSAGQLEPDADELLNVQFKAFSGCRSVHPTMTALERLPSVAPELIAEVSVATYPYAVGLSNDADRRTAIGARTSLEYCAASMLLDRELYPEAFVPDALADERRQALARRVHASVAPDMAQPLVRGSRVSVRLHDGAEHHAEVAATRWSTADPASEAGLREKFERLAGSAADRIQQAVDGLTDAPDLARLVVALGLRP